MRIMNPRETATIMGFPPSWRIPQGARVGQRGTGNALCVQMSHAIMLAAIAVYKDEPVPLPPPPLPPPPLSSPSVQLAPSAEEHLHPQDYTHLTKRLRSIETLLISMQHPTSS